MSFTGFYGKPFYRKLKQCDWKYDKKFIAYFLIKYVHNVRYLFSTDGN